MLKAMNPSSSWFDVISSLVTAQDFAVVGIASSILRCRHLLFVLLHACILLLATSISVIASAAYDLTRKRTLTQQGVQTGGDESMRHRVDSQCSVRPRELLLTACGGRQPPHGTAICVLAGSASATPCTGGETTTIHETLRSTRRFPLDRWWIEINLRFHERELCTLIFVLYLDDLKSDFSVMYVGLRKYQLTCGSVGFNSWAPTYQILYSMESGVTETRPTKVGDRSSESTAPTNADSLKSSYACGEWSRLFMVGAVVESPDRGDHEECRCPVWWDACEASCHVGCVRGSFASMCADLVSFPSSSSLVLRMGDVVSVKPIPRLACSGKCIAWCYEEATEDLIVMANGTTRSDS